LIWLIALASGQPLSFILMEAKAPDAPDFVKVVLGVAIGVFLLVIFEKMTSQQWEAFAALASGDRAACAKVLARRTRGGWIPDMDPFGTAALEVVAGTEDGARACLVREPGRWRLAGRLAACVEAHLDLLSQDPSRHRAALERLLALPPFEVVEARERYRALLIATAAASLAESDPATSARALEPLASSRDRGVRAFAAWVRTALDAPLEPGEIADEVRRTAGVAGAYGLGRLARTIESRAAAIERARAEAGPYRR
jgi:hypothetical protein